MEIIQAALNQSLILYFATPAVTCGVRSAENVRKLEYEQRRGILGYDMSILNEQIESKNDTWFNKPMYNIIIDTIER